MIWLGSTPILREHFGGCQGPPTSLSLPPCSREDLQIDNYLDCKELLPAPGNRSNKRRDREEDLATTEGERSERGRREGWRRKPGS
ncbi:hypothetical protein TNCV_2069271 [Trichonephila clavipes]|uniref:Uncharacterized protein n=1 Tax=Trichonephila clavipes TaxID=2585209 RepID=A0A8X6W2W7_TRICX|nr:hypothetical protein TNCV_2069271 [Trichonephila clavipes]